MNALGLLMTIHMVALQPPGSAAEHRASSAKRLTRGPFVSVQVNVGTSGENIVGDAANGPSIAVDPTDPNKIVIGWRQFDSVKSNFRQAGWSCSHDGGKTWRPANVLEPGQFREDAILDTDAEGTLYYYSLSSRTSAELFKSADGGLSWHGPVSGFGGDGARMAIDRTDGAARGHIYCAWAKWFTRSSNGGRSFTTPVDLPDDLRGDAIAVGPDGTLYVAGITSQGFQVARSSNARDADSGPSVAFLASVNLGGEIKANTGPNPGGPLGRLQLAVDHSLGRTRGNLYMLCSVDPPGPDPLDIMVVRSTDGGATWTEPVRVNDDDDKGANWQWFGTMSVAPNGRIDVIWNDTRNTGHENLAEVFYAFSTDAGVTWSANRSVTPVFDSHVGWPNQDKLGDEHAMVSDNTGVNVAYAATFNREQDVYFLRIPREP